MDPGARRSGGVEIARRGMASIHVAFYPWMTVRAYARLTLASFRAHWNRDTEGALLQQFPARTSGPEERAIFRKASGPALALITAICPEPELLVLDEPTSGLDPIVRREFIQTVIGAYQDSVAGTAHGVRVHAPDLRVRGADRRVHDHRSGPRSADARRGRRARALRKRSTRASSPSPARSICQGRACSVGVDAKSRSSPTATRGRHGPPGRAFARESHRRKR